MEEKPRRTQKDDMDRLYSHGYLSGSVGAGDGMSLSSDPNSGLELNDAVLEAAYSEDRRSLGSIPLATYVQLMGKRINEFASN